MFKAWQFPPGSGSLFHLVLLGCARALEIVSDANELYVVSTVETSTTVTTSTVTVTPSPTTYTTVNFLLGTESAEGSFWSSTSHFVKSPPRANTKL